MEETWDAEKLKKALLLYIAGLLLLAAFTIW